jgi:hypothetical protein
MPVGRLERRKPANSAGVSFDISTFPGARLMLGASEALRTTGRASTPNETEETPDMIKSIRRRLAERTASPRYSGTSRFTRTKVAIVGALAALVVAASFAVAGPASAQSGNCSWGLNTRTTAWGHCNEVGTRGYLDGFRLVVNCYYYPQRISYGTAGQSIYASCPSWSYVTWEQATPWNT